MGCSKCRYSPRGCARCVNNFTKVNGTRVHGATSTSARTGTGHSPTMTASATPKRTKISNASKIAKATKTPVQRVKATNKGGVRHDKGRSSLSGSVDAVKTPAMLGERDENRAPRPLDQEFQVQQTQHREYFQKQNALKMTTATTTERNMQKKRSRVHDMMRDENGNIEEYEEDLLPSSRRRVLFENEEEDMPSPTPIGAMSPGTEAAMLAHVMATSPSSMTLGGALSDLPHSPLAAAFAMVNELLDSPRLARRSELAQGVGGGPNNGWDF